jgi:hypothetical protein
LKTRSDDFGGILALAVCFVACPLFLVVMMCGSYTASPPLAGAVV